MLSIYRSTGFYRKGRVEDIERDSDCFSIYARSSRVYRYRAVIIAIGLERKKLGIPGKAEYAERDDSYCTVCDVRFFKDKRIVIVSKGNSRVTGLYILLAMHLRSSCAFMGVYPYLA